jgi:hypothetical protein
MALDLAYVNEPSCRLIMHVFDKRLRHSRPTLETRLPALGLRRHLNSFYNKPTRKFQLISVNVSLSDH